MGRLACLGNEQANLNYSMGLGPFFGLEAVGAVGE